MREAYQTQTFVVSLGGSLVVPDGIDASFLVRFKNCIEAHARAGRSRFIIVVGGGKTTRRYQEAARNVSPLTDEDADWLGIHSTRLNAHLLRTIFKDIAHPRLFAAPEDVVEFSEPVAIGAGWRPGWSTDYVAVSIAETIGGRRIANLSNIDYVYESDPRVNPGAKRFDRISWDAYRTLIPDAWSPGLNTPFDPIASKKAKELGMEVAVISGLKLENFEKYLNGDAFEGTIIA